MNWLVKVTAFKLLSIAPGGSALYRMIQERFTGSLVPTQERLRQKIDIGVLYAKWLSENGRADLLKGAYLDFGAGWHPTIPFLFYSMGVERLFLLDVASRLNEELILGTLRVFREIVTAADWPSKDMLSRLPDPPSDPATPWPKMLNGYGMSYIAPYAGNLEKLNGSIDLVTSTQVLLHIGRDGLRHCFRDIHRALKPGGIFFATIHLKDLWADTDRRLSRYNHLRYSPWLWENVINSPLMPFNRLRGPDYRELLEEAGFKIRHFELEPPTDADMRLLAETRVHPCFQKYSPRDLAEKHLFFAAEKV